MKTVHSDVVGIPESRLGTNQSGMRAYNEKLVLTILRRNGALPKAEIAKITGLSAQTVSVIMRALEADQLLTKGAPLRGKVGQPSVPIALNPEGAYFLGSKIGRRSVEVILTDFLGQILNHKTLAYSFPTADTIMSFVVHATHEILDKLSKNQRQRVAGMGVAMPYEIWKWAELINVAPRKMEHWKDHDIGKELSAIFNFPVLVQNDATAACGAELIFGTQIRPQNFLYIYVGYFVGGGIVLNDQLFSGAFGNAGAIGSMPVIGPTGKLQQLIETSSIASLEVALKSAGFDSELVWDEDGLWEFPKQIVTDWIDQNANGLAQAILSSSSVIDFQAVLIDGWLPERIRTRIVERTREIYMSLDQSGLSPLEIVEGSIGINARPLGAASLPLSDRYMEGVDIPEMNQKSISVS